MASRSAGTQQGDLELVERAFQRSLVGGEAHQAACIACCRARHHAIVAQGLRFLAGSGSPGQGF